MNELRNIERVEITKKWIVATSILLIVIGVVFANVAVSLEPTIWNNQQMADPAFLDEDYPPKPRRTREVSADSHPKAIRSRWFSAGFLILGFTGFMIPWDKILR